MAEIVKHPAADVEIKIIFDNKLTLDGLTPEWGFSCLIKVGNESILFDTGGNADIFISNFNKMNIDPASINTVMISHDHWDHTAGIEEFYGLNKKPPLYLLSSFSEGTKNSAGQAGANISPIDKPTEILPGCLTTGEMPTNRANLYEHSLFINSDKGTIIITGCAHAGIVNIIEKCREMLGNEIYYVLGGFHLFETPEDEVQAIVRGCLDLNINYISPCHCTGETAINMFHKSFGTRFIDIGAGTEIDFGKLR